jgi:alpha-1,3-mannosyltransferase
MANPTEAEVRVEEPPRHVAYYRQAKELAMGTHPWSKRASIALLFADALLTSLIITYVPCKASFWP